MLGTDKYYKMNPNKRQVVKLMAYFESKVQFEIKAVYQGFFFLSLFYQYICLLHILL